MHFAAQRWLCLCMCVCACIDERTVFERVTLEASKSKKEKNTLKKLIRKKKLRNWMRLSVVKNKKQNKTTCNRGLFALLCTLRGKCMKYMIGMFSLCVQSAEANTTRTIQIYSILRYEAVWTRKAPAAHSQAFLQCKQAIFSSSLHIYRTSRHFIRAVVPSSSSCDHSEPSRSSENV